MLRLRDLRRTFLHARAHFPAVVVTGPRQSGKTTMLRAEAPDAAYVSLDDPLEKAFAQEDPNGLLDRATPAGMILDEIQNVPELLPHLRRRIDADRSAYGRWMISGSQRFAVMQGASESLAGRAAILDLLPFSLAELGSTDLGGAIWAGGYPDPALRPEVRDLWLPSYVQTYVQRDVRQVRNVHDLRRFEQFLGLIAAHHAQELKVAPIAADLGVSQPTINDWVSVLGASWLAATLPPWHRNLGKRLVKAPKLYLIDPALACFLTRQPSGAAALAGPMGGALFEGLVVIEALKAFANRGLPPAWGFWRSHDGVEVDLLLEAGGRVFPVEIKLTATPTARHVEPLLKLRSWLGADAEPGLLVCRVQAPMALPHGALAIPWQAWPQWLADRLG